MLHARRTYIYDAILVNLVNISSRARAKYMDVHVPARTAERIEKTLMTGYAKMKSSGETRSEGREGDRIDYARIIPALLFETVNRA